MFHSLPRRLVPLFLAVVAVITLFQLLQQRNHQDAHSSTCLLSGFFSSRTTVKWSIVPRRYPVESPIPLPTEPPRWIPQIQSDFRSETAEERAKRETRLARVKEAFLHSWDGYRKHAWLQDEVLPLSGKASNNFGGWGATLIDSLDTLWIMGLQDEFTAAVSEINEIDFSIASLERLNTFETTIRFLGGLLGAYDVSGQRSKVLLEKAVELGDILYVAFDTPMQMPITRWDWKNAANGGEQEAEGHALLAEVGSMTLEFTRLSQLTGDPKYYDAVARVSDVLHERQNQTKIPGLWPQMLDMRRLDFHQDPYFNIGSLSDSMYEYLPKAYLLLGGRSPSYLEMYSTALKAAKENLFFQPLNPENKKMLLTGMRKHFSVFSDELLPDCEHLSCFAGGMVALAAQVFEQADDLEIARQLVDGCLWAYESMPSGIMPETFVAAACSDKDNNCMWSQERWYEAVNTHSNKKSTRLQPRDEAAQKIIIQNSLSPGMVEIRDPRYNLRPELIESMFVLYRVTGDRVLQDKAWKMFQTINNITRTEFAYAAISDVTQELPTLFDSMESFWTAETLKYFYLIFSEPDVINLDDYVFNTEAHPLLRPKAE